MNTLYSQQSTFSGARLFARCVGLASLIFGIAGFVPVLHTAWPGDVPALTIENAYGQLFGLFPNNALLSLIHVVVGVWGLVAAVTVTRARRYAWGVALLFGLLAVCGGVPALRTFFGLMPLFGNNLWLHGVIALLALAVAALAEPKAREINTNRPVQARASATHTAPVGVASSVTIGRRPLHPFLVPFPIAFLIGALITDMAQWWTTMPWYGDYGDFFARASFWLLCGGLVSGIGAASAGAVDFVSLKRVRGQTAGWVHAFGNIIVLLLALANVLLRAGDKLGALFPWGLVLSAATAGLLFVTIWCGNGLVYRHLIGVVGEPSRDPTTRSVDS